MNQPGKFVITFHGTFRSTGLYGTFLAFGLFELVCLWPLFFGLKIFLVIGLSGKHEAPPSVSELAGYSASVSDVFNFSTLGQLEVVTTDNLS